MKFSLFQMRKEIRLLFPVMMNWLQHLCLLSAKMMSHSVSLFRLLVELKLKLQQHPQEQATAREKFIGV
jgi:hypothetical protein